MTLVNTPADEPAWRVVWPKRGIAVVESQPIPHPAVEQVLVRSLCSLLSPGTERAFLLALPGTPGTFPYYPGYSVVGSVMESGAEAGWDSGQRVACWAPHASHVVVDVAACVAVPVEVADDEAVFFNLAAIALNGVRKAGIQLGEGVAVIGAGLIGLLAVQLAKLSGALNVCVADLCPARLQIARSLGADATLDVEAGQKEVPSCAEDEAAVVIEASGHPEAAKLAFRLARPGGRVVLLGSTRGVVNEVDFYRDVYCKDLHIIGAYNPRRPRHDSSRGAWTLHDDQKLVLELLNQRRLRVRELVTHRFAGRDATRAYELLQQDKESSLGIVLNWHESTLDAKE